MSAYYALLGNHPLLSLAELQALVPETTLFLDTVALLPSDINPENLVGKLGGTVKIVSELGTVSAADQLTTIIVEHLLSTDQKKVVFTLNQLGKKVEVDPFEIKKELVASGCKVRFIETPHALAAAHMQKNQPPTELILFEKDGTIHITKTEAIQDINAWSTRDRSRPYADHKRGMLPPKVARIMINLATQGKKCRVFDPFCGTGTVLMEAAVLGCDTMGSDLDQKAVFGAQTNMNWLLETNLSLTPPHLFQADATKVSMQHLPAKADAIVTEPYLGKQTPDEKSIPGIIKGLEKLYIGSLRQWRQILSKQGRVVMVLPEFTYNGRAISLKQFVDKLPQLGYTTLSEPLEYSRPNATTRRLIYQLEVTE
jgi:tRNA G10  N-methylase Trm11